MNASVTAVGDIGQPLPADAEMTALFWGLQYCRASTLSLTRLELALESGDRQRIIEAMDRLHALDGEIERRVASLPPPTGQDPDRDAINQHLGREKMAVAFEKLVLASGISGPGLASPSALATRAHSIGMPAPDLDWPDPADEAPTVSRLTSAICTYGPTAGLMLALAAATGAVIFAAL